MEWLNILSLLDKSKHGEWCGSEFNKTGVSDGDWVNLSPHYPATLFLDQRVQCDRSIGHKNMQSNGAHVRNILAIINTMTYAGIIDVQALSRTSRGPGMRVCVVRRPESKETMHSAHQTGATHCQLVHQWPDIVTVT